MCLLLPQSLIHTHACKVKITQVLLCHHPTEIITTGKQGKTKKDYM